jgi:positive control factor
MQDLLREYKETRRQLKRAYEARREGEKVLDNQAITERQLLSEMISDVEYVIEWLETGRRPGNRRGVERLAAYQREKPMDPIRMQAFVANSTAGSPANLTEWERQQIEDALCVLSEREKECYVMAYGECFSHSEIAEMLNLSVSSVETYLKRANLKITERTQNSLFLVG